MTNGQSDCGIEFPYIEAGGSPNAGAVYTVCFLTCSGTQEVVGSSHVPNPNFVEIRMKSQHMHSWHALWRSY